MGRKEGIDENSWDFRRKIVSKIQKSYSLKAANNFNHSRSLDNLQWQILEKNKLPTSYQ